MLGGGSYAGQLIAAWLSILAALMHLAHKAPIETIAFALLELSCLVCGALETGAIESRTISPALFPSRIAMMMAAVIYVIILATGR